MGIKGPSQRDRRLDIFRGLALIFIFVDHIPGNPLGWFTLRNYGFSDATEIFVFISGYSVVLTYGNSRVPQGFLFTSACILRRSWQLYAAHILLFVIFAAHVASVTASQNSPMFAEEMKIASFLQDPGATLFQVLLLRFRPRNMDVLPLYIVLMLCFPVFLPLLRRFPWAALGLSGGVWLMARIFDLNFHTYPNGGVWYFNPSAWQFLFVLGGFVAFRPEVPVWFRRRAKIFDLPVALYLVFSLVVVLGWRFSVLKLLIPSWISGWMYPINKTDLDTLRLIHFLCLAYATTRLIGPDNAIVDFRPFRPLELCGRHSLQIFCLGTLLSLIAIIFTSGTGGSLGAHLAAAAAGIAIMFLAAAGLDWYQRRNREQTAARRKEIHAP